MAIGLITLEVLWNKFDVSTESLRAARRQQRSAINWLYDRGRLGKESTGNGTA